MAADNCASPAISQQTKNFLGKFRDPNTRILNKFNAHQFSDTWHHFDKDNSGYIEEKEIDQFLKEFITSVVQGTISNEVISETAYEQLKIDFMDAYDENDDGRIEIGELAQILPNDEEFLLLFRRKNPLKTSVDFIKLWRKYDKDCSGFIEVNEMRDFLRDLLGQTGKTDADLDSSTDYYLPIIIDLFDTNKDGKLQLSEMARLLPIKENYLAKPLFSKATNLTRAEIERVFAAYDQDKNGIIEIDEIIGLLSDLMELAREPYDEAVLEQMKTDVMNQFDENKDGHLDKKEFKMILTEHTKIVDVVKKPMSSRILLKRKVKK